MDLWIIKGEQKVVKEKIKISNQEGWSWAFVSQGEGMGERIEQNVDKMVKTKAKINKKATKNWCLKGIKQS